jgi:peptidoglycan-N-acetylglucosamine deacetylase
MIPVRTPFFLPLLYPSLLWRMPSDKPELYLTFDDGPISGPTEFVLETLEKLSCLGSFFCIGDNIRKYPQVFDKIIAGGHTVGNHTYNHLDGWKTPLPEYVDNVERCLHAMSQKNPSQANKRFFRPPYGKISRKGITALSAQYNIVMWDVLTQDFSPALSPEACLKKSISATRHGSIILFHDSLKAERNLTFVLPRFISHFLEKGFVFKSLPS